MQTERHFRWHSKKPIFYLSGRVLTSPREGSVVVVDCKQKWVYNYFHLPGRVNKSLIGSFSSSAVLKAGAISAIALWKYRYGNQCFGSGSGLDPDSIWSVDPEPDPGGQK
jgi:hypothetical protein